MVLIYEGVVAQVLDFDYAPASCLVEGRRKYFNVSQEGRSDVDFLREEELVNGLKLASKDYTPVTCYQISEKGLEVVKKLSKADKEAVHELAYAPGTRELMRVEWDGEGELYTYCAICHLSPLTSLFERPCWFPSAAGPAPIHPIHPYTLFLPLAMP
jgi:hypothetical protein